MDVFQAAEKGNIKRLEELKGEINSRNQNGETPLYLACQYRDAFETVDWLLKNGADPNIQALDGYTPLIVTVDGGAKNSVQIIKALIDTGADVNLAQRDGWTALMFAVRYSGTSSSPEIVKLLLESGADPKLSSKDKSNVLIIAALHISTGQVSPAVLPLLLQYGAKIDLQGARNKTPLMYAVEKSDEETARFFIENGADINAKNSEGKTPLDLVKEFYIAKFLYEEGGRSGMLNEEETLIKINNLPKTRRPYRKIRFLGKGAQGSVYEVEKYENGKRYAMKDIEKSGDASRIKKLRKTNLLQEKLDHPYISKVFESYEDDKNIVIIMELCQQDLKDFIAIHSLSNQDIVYIMLNLIDAVLYLEGRNILHADIKIENILMCDIDGRYIPKIIDFGSAIISPEKNAYHYTGFYENMAPEMCNRMSFASNVWQLGIVLFYLIYKEKPFPNLNFGDPEICYRFVKENRVKLPRSTPFDEVLLSMLDPNPKTRMSLKTCQTVFWNYRNEIKLGNKM